MHARLDRTSRQTTRRTPTLKTLSALFTCNFLKRWLSAFTAKCWNFNWNVSAGWTEMAAGGGGGGGQLKMVPSFSLFLDTLLLVAARVEVKGEVGPLVARREGDGLAQREAHGVNDPLATRLRGAQADRGRPGGAPQDVRRGERSPCSGGAPWYPSRWGAGSLAGSSVWRGPGGTCQRTQLAIDQSIDQSINIHINTPQWFSTGGSPGHFERVTECTPNRNL